MRSNEEFEIGGNGIDTQYERDYINYRPKIKYETPTIDSSEGLSADTASQPDILQKLGESSIISVWEDVVDVIQKVDKVEVQLSEKLKDVTVPVHPIYQQAIMEAAEKLGYSGITNSIPFDLYKKTFENPDSPESALIQDAFEEYMSDVDGNLNGELYADVAEIKNDWKDMIDFVNRGLFAQVVTMDKIPNEISKEDINLEEIHNKEQGSIAEYAELLKLKAVNDQIIEGLEQKEFGSERYYETVAEQEELKREIIRIEKRLFTRTEMVDLIEQKASDTNDSIGLIENTIDFDPYTNNKYEVLYGLLKQFKTKEQMQKGLRKMQAVLKLSVDGKKTNVNGVKSNLRGIAGGKAKRHTNRALINGIHLRNEVFNEVYDIMGNLDAVPNVRNFETLATHISDGMQQAELMYHGQASDFYKIHAMDSELRTDKLASVINKDAARSAYKLIDRVVGYSKDINSSWPTEDSLSQWLNDFMEHSKIT
jgi:hypothetical protein